VYLSAALVARCQSLPDASRLDVVLRESGDVARVPVGDARVLQNFNTPADLQGRVQ
jgi:hypothetical protein